MAYEDWNKVEEEDEDDLQDSSIFEGQRDVILFCIDCSESMHELYDDPKHDGQQTSKLFTALESATQIQTRKVVVGPNDAVGILLFNIAKSGTSSRGTEFKSGTYLFQPIEQISAPKIQELIQLLHEARENPDYLREEFPPLADKRRVPTGDVFTSCNWALRDGAPKTGYKRIFLVTDEDNPHPGPRGAQLLTSAKTTLTDLTQAGVSVEPLFISTDAKPFDPYKFYSTVLRMTRADTDDDESEGLLPDSISITRIDDLLAQMRFREMPKRAQFSIPFELYEGLVIGVKGYSLVSEQKKGPYKYFMDLGDRLEGVEAKTAYMDDEQQRDIDKNKILYGLTLGPAAAEAEEEAISGTRAVPARSKVFFTADEIKMFKTLGLEPGIKLLGFKDPSELAVEDNIKHSIFIFPDEGVYSGSKRTFTALLKTLVKKNKIGLVRVVMRRGLAPVFCAVLPQEEKTDETGYTEPAGFHLIPYPFADDLRAAPIEQAYRASSDVAEAAKAFVAKLQIKDGSYPPDANPNPALAYHYAQLEASAFREEYDPSTFEDPTLPRYDMIHKRAGALMREWKAAVARDPAADTTIIGATAGTKRKADVSVADAEIRSKYDSGQLSKLRVDQLKEFLKSKSQPVSGKKGELVERVADWLDKHA